jgi:hypothetical protein
VAVDAAATGPGEGDGLERGGSVEPRQKPRTPDQQRGLAGDDDKNILRCFFGELGILQPPHGNPPDEWTGGADHFRKRLLIPVFMVSDQQ